MGKGFGVYTQRKKENSQEEKTQEDNQGRGKAAKDGKK